MKKLLIAVACAALASPVMASELNGPVYGGFQTSDVMGGDTMPQIKTEAFNGKRKGYFSIHGVLGMVLWSWSFGEGKGEAVCDSVKATFMSSPVDASYCRYTNGSFYVNLDTTNPDVMEQVRTALKNAPKDETRFLMFAGGESFYNNLNGFKEATSRFARERALHVQQWQEMNDNLQRLVDKNKGIEDEK